ncbi:DUF3226 domain-containing protein [Nonlabens ulvanivorans]|uniref:DUF3226 domain-containing protein n=1 Tax=Nonlabens ulvanivorans TaxID=906888 RepID=UPI0037C8D1DD
MAENIIIVLCEGPHDVAFLTKILKYNDFKSYENLGLKDYPIPMNSLMVQGVQKSNYQDLNLHMVRQTTLPSSILKKGVNSLFLYSMGGDSKKEIRQSLLKELVSFLPQDGKIQILPADSVLNIVYFFDADDKGISNRLHEVQQEIKEVVKIEDFENGGVTSYLELKIGGFIFSDDAGFGKLEDILLPLMQLENEDIFENAESFYKNFENGERGKQRNKDIKKSTIGIAGQLQNSGATNTVTIKHSDYLSQDKIEKDRNCQSIISFFQNFTA